MHDVQTPTETTSAYVNTEIARLLLRDDSSRELASTRAAIAEAAYYLSDPIEPHERERLLVTAEVIRARCSADAQKGRAADALGFLSEAANEVERLLQGPGDNSEARIARKAVFHAISDLARHVGIATDPTRRVSAYALRSGRIGALRRARRAAQ
jgi:hypothetical protein